MTQPKRPPVSEDMYGNANRVDRLPSEDPTTGDLFDDTETSGPRVEGDSDELDTDDESITGDEELYETVEGEAPADEEDVLEEDEDMDPEED